MSYLSFLGEWYNLPFVGVALAGVVIGVRSTRRPRPDIRAGAAFLTGIAGLTINGAIHDLSVGSPAERFPLVILSAVTLGVGLTLGGSLILRRLFPRVTGVTWNEPGLEGSIAQIVTATAGPDSPAGRARVRDDDGVVHVVRIHAPGASLRFGRQVRLGPFDASRSSYPVEPV
ncbi:MAG: YqiJ family protein [Gemmatimonadota bacterium]|nr:YqiJ family protein [Gemmatimonadota bacterium]MDH3427882.1 YqiJ family protein [Gemmatimonadota bacterium]